MSNNLIVRTPLKNIRRGDEPLSPCDTKDLVFIPTQEESPKYPFSNSEYAAEISSVGAGGGSWHLDSRWIQVRRQCL